MTGWAVLGLEAAGVNPLDLRCGGKTPIDYLRSTPREITTTGDIERTILALEAAGRRPARFRGQRPRRRAAAAAQRRTAPSRARSNLDRVRRVRARGRRRAASS